MPRPPATSAVPGTGKPAISAVAMQTATTSARLDTPVALARDRLSLTETASLHLARQLEHLARAQDARP